MNATQKLQATLKDAAHMLVSAQIDCVEAATQDHASYVEGYYRGKRAAGRFILRQAVLLGGKKERAAVRGAVRDWISYFNGTNYGFRKAVAK